MKIGKYHWLLTLFLILSLFPGLGKMELNGEEPRRAVVAMEMMESGNYLSPHIYGLPYYNKPPVHNWAIVLCMKLIGTSEFSARLPGVLGYVLCGLILFLWIKRHMDETLGWWAMMFYLCAADLFFYGSMRSGEIDLFFSLWVLIDILCVYTAVTHSKSSWLHWLIAYLALAIGILTKLYAAIPFHIIGLALAIALHRSRMKSLLSGAHLTGLLTSIVIVLGYYTAYGGVEDITRWWINQSVEVNHNSQNGGLITRLNHLVSSPLRLLKIILPWSLFIFALRSKELRQRMMKQPEVVFMTGLVLVNFILIWLFFKSRDRYFYPLIAPTAMVLAWISLHTHILLKRQKVFLIIIVVMILLRLGAVFFFYPKMDDGTLSDRYLYRETVDSILAATSGAPVHFIAKKETFVLDDRPYGISKHTRQPVLPYQLSFYLGSRTGVMPQLRDTMLAGQWYLIHDTLYTWTPTYECPYNFNEYWFDQPLSIIRPMAK